MAGERQILKELRAEFKLKALANFKTITEVSKIEIPDEKTLFPGTSNDYWHRVNIAEENIDACLYYLSAKGSFPPHYHKSQTEHLIPITVGAKLEIVTNKYDEVIEFPNSIFFKPSEPHAVRNLSNKPIVLLVLWTPKFVDGWTGEFLKNKNKCTNQKAII